MGLSIGNITLDAADALGAATFWAAVLGWKAAGWSTPEEAAVPDPQGGPGLYFMRVPEDKRLKNRVHLDLNPDGGAQAEIDRVIALGATRQQGFESHTVLTDPEGNEFCITGTPG